MTAWYHRAGNSIYDEDGDDVREFIQHFTHTMDDRIGAPPPSLRRRAIKRTAIAAILAAAFTWAVYERETVWPLLTAAAEITRAALATAPAKPAPAPEVAAASEPTPPAPLETTEVSPITTPPDAQPATTEAHEATASAEPAVAPIPPASTAPGPADPLRQRAEAAGLHPSLSRALLAKLSDADFKNAGLAIDKALAETDDGATLIWPRAANPGLAQFEVYFTEGAETGCRRYVVAIAKDGWLTTALPMQRCGVKKRFASAKRG